MTTIRTLAAALVLTLAACSSPARPPAAPVVDRLPTEAEVRTAAAAYLGRVRAEIVEITLDERSVGIYVRGVPAWTPDQFVEHLPDAAETARGLLHRWPYVADVDICGDGPWLPRDEYDTFAAASRVRVFRDRLARLPGEFTTPEQVLHEGGTTRSIDFYLDPRIIRDSARYREAARANLGKTPPTP